MINIEFSGEWSATITDYLKAMQPDIIGTKAEFRDCGPLKTGQTVTVTVGEPGLEIECEVLIEQQDEDGAWHGTITASRLVT